MDLTRKPFEASDRKKKILDHAEKNYSQAF